MNNVSLTYEVNEMTISSVLTEQTITACHNKHVALNFCRQNRHQGQTATLTLQLQDQTVATSKPCLTVHEFFDFNTSQILDANLTLQLGSLCKQTYVFHIAGESHPPDIGEENKFMKYE